MAHTYEKRRQRIRNLIELAIQDGNVVKQAQGYYLLNLINKRLSDAYQMDGRFSNLY